MKILQVIEFFSRRFGGSVNSVYNLSVELSKEGNDVTILTTDAEFDEDYVKHLKSLGVQIIPFKSLFNFGLFFYTPSIKKWLDDNLKKFDVIHLHNFRTYQNFIVSKYANDMDVPYVIQARGSVLPFFQKKLLKNVFDYIWGFDILRQAKAVLALTEDESGQYRQMGVQSDKIFIIPNGLDLLNYRDVYKVKGKFSLKYKVKNNEKIIVYLGRIHKIKGIDLLICAFSLLLKEFDNIRLVITGPDDGIVRDLKKLVEEKNIESKVIFTGPLYGDDKIEVYADSDLYVLPSSYEAFPNTVLEAMSCEIPVIITNGCKIADIIDGKAGLKVKNDSKDLKIAMSKILSNEKLRNEFGKAGKEIIIKNYTMKKVINDILFVYRNVIEN